MIAISAATDHPTAAATEAGAALVAVTSDFALGNVPVLIGLITSPGAGRRSNREYLVGPPIDRVLFRPLIRSDSTVSDHSLSLVNRPQHRGGYHMSSSSDSGDRIDGIGSSADFSRCRLPVGITQRLLGRHQAAAYLAISTPHFELHVAHHVGAVLIGRRRLYDVRALDRWLDAKCEKSSTPEKSDTEWLKELES
jgi:hypothetical protein